MPRVKNQARESHLPQSPRSERSCKRRWRPRRAPWTFFVPALERVRGRCCDRMFVGKDVSAWLSGCDFTVSTRATQESYQEKNKHKKENCVGTPPPTHACMFVRGSGVGMESEQAVVGRYRKRERCECRRRRLGGGWNLQPRGVATTHSAKWTRRGQFKCAVKTKAGKSSQTKENLERFTNVETFSGFGGPLSSSKCSSGM